MKTRTWVDALGITFSDQDSGVTLEEIGDGNPRDYCWPTVYETKQAEKVFRREIERLRAAVATGETSPEFAVASAVHSVWAAGRLFERQGGIPHGRKRIPA